MNTEVSPPAGVLLVGGGVVGLLSAVKLAEAGFRVTILEQGRIGREASWAGAGILSPLYPWHYPPALLQLALYGMQRYGRLAATLFEQTGIDPEWNPSGLFILDGPQEKIPDDALNWAKAWGLDWRLESPKRDDQFSLSEAKALWCPEVAQVRNPRLLAALAARCRQVGVHLEEDITVTGFRQRQGRLRGVETSRGFIPAERSIVTAGAWSGTLLRETGNPPNILPVRGQMLLLQGKPGNLSTMVMRDHRYLVQRRDGLFLVGSTSELVGFDKSTTSVARQELWDFACAVFPDIVHAPLLRQWSGLRPGSQDNIPYIGPLPGWEGLFVAAGHFRYGLTNALATADILVALLTETPTPLDITPYALSAQRLTHNPSPERELALHL